MQTAPSRIVLAMLFAAGLAVGGCVYYEPYPHPYPVASTYERSWNAALGAMRDQGVEITREDRSAGVIEGQRGALRVKANVVTQADGRIRVELNTSGDLQQDPGLSDRISRSYDARMGR
ncbi:MAG TPA: hypothetical protein VLY46_09975 [Usitatibacter sp.]|nr:hypothetical protein [Usitatibacter sp.]